MSRLLALSDPHVGFAQNRALLEEVPPGRDGDWLIVAGDVAEQFAEVVWALQLLAGRFERVIWVPGNHELWTPRNDPVQLRGVERYEALVAAARELGVITPEDAYPVWRGDGREVIVAPLFLLYDYTFRPPGTQDKASAVKVAYDRGIVCTDEVLLHSDPYPSKEDWCVARIEMTQQRLAQLDATLPTVLVNHYPLVRDPTLVLRYPEFALWCGTERTADWHVRFRAEVVVYGHLHIPRTTMHDDVRFEEVSVGYPHEWRRRGRTPELRVIFDSP